MVCLFVCFVSSCNLKILSHYLLVSYISIENSYCLTFVPFFLWKFLMCLDMDVFFICSICSTSLICDLMYFHLLWKVLSHYLFEYYFCPTIFLLLGFSYVYTILLTMFYTYYTFLNMYFPLFLCHSSWIFSFDTF